MDEYLTKFIKRYLFRSKMAEKVVRSGLVYYESKVGPRDALQIHAEIQLQELTLENSIKVIQHRWPTITSKATESPIFILSAGWRSGSTLLQRLVMSKEPLLVWGEPYSHIGLIHHQSLPLRVFTSDLPPDDWFINSSDVTNLSNQWVANLYPQCQDLLDANVSYFRTLFGAPAAQLGFSRWGLKDVRLTVDHAIYLKWLFPKAKFLFLYRNPYKAYCSYRPARSWYKEWPNTPVFTPKQFAKFWVELTTGFISGYEKVGGLLVKYEDLCAGNINVDYLSDYLDVDIDASVLDSKIGSSNVNSLVRVPRYEINQLRQIVEPLAASLGYSDDME